MARSRTLRPSFFSSFSLAEVSRDCRLLFAGLWVEADDEGRLIDSPKHLAGAVFPHDDDVTGPMVKDWLDDLVKIEAIRRYETPNGRYIVIVNWSEHQKPPHPTPSKLPPPPLPPAGLPDSRDFHEDSANVSREGQEHDMSVSRDAHSLGLGLGSGLGSGFGSCSGLGSGSGPSADSAGQTDQATGPDVEPADELRRRRLAQRLANACSTEGRRAARAEAEGIIAWASQVLSLDVIDEAVGWATKLEKPLVHPRGIETTMIGKAKDHGLTLERFHPEAWKRIG